MAAIILAGGKGERLGGEEKALLKLGGKTLLAWVVARLQPLFAELILVTNSPRLYPAFPGRVVTDMQPGRGPLGGMEAGLLAAEDPVNFIAGCDMPFLNRQLIRDMEVLSRGYDIVIPRVGSFIEPLHAFYSRRALKRIQEQLQAGDYKLSSLLVPPLRVGWVAETAIRARDPELLSFFNINTRADLERARRFLEREVDDSGSDQVFPNK